MPLRFFRDRGIQSPEFVVVVSGYMLVVSDILWAIFFLWS